MGFRDTGFCHRKTERGDFLKTQLSPALEAYFEEALKRYLALGGLPEVIQSFLSSGNNYMEARSVQTRLLHDYRGDFGRFINDDGSEGIDYALQTKLSQVFDSIPKQLSRENENYKFKFSEVKHGGRLSQFTDAIDWLEKAGLILRVYNTKAIESPLEAKADKDAYKIFLADTGLLMASYPLSILQDYLQGKLGSRKGALYENLAATMIHKAGFPLYYYGDSVRHLEIDYLLETKDGITLYEEKSTNGRMAASKAVMEGKTPYHASKCMKVIQSGFL